MISSRTLPAATSRPVDSHPAMPPVGTRLASIDILRAITMVLMIFVNDLWTLRDIPAWLEHVSIETDGMGLADTIFPAFLFIVGMSIPFAIASRRGKGEDRIKILFHVAGRTLALLVMGLFFVNGESINTAVTGLDALSWYALSCIAFILIWNAYPPTVPAWVKRTLRATGIAALLILAFIYRGGEGNDLVRFSTHWWGILGLIGWSYLVSAFIAAFAGEKFSPIAGAWLAFCALSMLNSAGLVPDGFPFNFIPGPVMAGTFVAITLGGVLTGVVLRRLRQQSGPVTLIVSLLLIAAGLLMLGFYTRTFWGISKLKATPAWLFTCSALTIIAFVAVYWLADLRRKAHWFTPIKPAGTDTLLCYLMPYFAYAGISMLGIHWPDAMLTGALGLAKSFAFALLCVWGAGLLSKNGVHLKL